MIRCRVHDDVTELHMTSRVSRAFGYSVSAWLYRGALIDIGFPKVAGELSAVLDALRPQGAFITHHHEDHAGNAEVLARRGLPLAVSDATLQALRNLRPIALYRWITWGTPQPLQSPLVPYEHGMLRLVAAPGHSSDHHVVWDPERETLFSGDLYLGVKVRVAHPGENPRQLAASLRATAALRPSRLFCAHRGAVPQATAALIAKADWVEQTIGEIERRMDAGWPDRAIRQAVLGPESPSGWLSGGDYSRINFVRAVRRTRQGPT